MTFIKKYKTKDDYIIVKKGGRWFGVYLDDEDGNTILIHVTRVSRLKNGALTKGSSLTVPKYRNYGAYMLGCNYVFNRVFSKTETWITWSVPVTARCLEEYFGFKRRQTLKNGTAKMMRKGVAEDE